MPSFSIRRARPDDLSDLTSIYNYYIESTPTTFDLVPFSVEERRAWLEGFAEAGPYQIFVATKDLEGSETAVGYACSHRFRPKAAYAPSVEASVYCDPSVVGKGIGSALYTELFAALAQEPVHRAYAGITLPNAASVALHEAMGFEPLATYSEVGFKMDRYWDVLWLEKKL